MKLGRPEQFHDKVSIRLGSIERAIAQYRVLAKSRVSVFASSLGKHTALFRKGYGNDIDFLSVTKALFFSNRELIDLYLGRINRATSDTGSATPRDFVPFARSLVREDFPHKDELIFAFLRTNFDYIFHVRKIRNEMKANPTKCEFLFNTDHFEMRMELPIKPEDTEFLAHLDMRNLEAATTRGAYMATLHLDAYFPETLAFWSAFRNSLQKSFAH